MNLRDRFRLPTDAEGRPLLYLCGHSLGPMPHEAARVLAEELEEWGQRAVGGHFEARRPWVRYQEHLAPGLAALVGAEVEEVVAMNTLTVNLHLMMVSFFRPAGARTKIVMERGAFPSDRQAVVSQLAFHGLDPAEHLIELEPREGEATLREEDVEALFEREGPRIALALLPGIQYYTGQSLDLERLVRAARAQGCAVGLDLAHAFGNVPLRLHEWGPDFAVWCHYKYGNAGPGAIGGCFVHARHAQAPELPRFAGWWGHELSTRFQMGPGFTPEAGAAGWQLSTPPLLSLAPLRASLGLFEEAGGIGPLRARSLELTGRLERGLDERLAGRVQILTPREPARRGCQLSLGLAGGRARGRAAFEALGARGVVCDWREPGVIRVAPAPLYNTVEEVDRFVDLLDEVLAG